MMTTKQIFVLLALIAGFILIYVLRTSQCPVPPVAIETEGLVR
jgi:hypothetical protein